MRIIITGMNSTTKPKARSAMLRSLSLRWANLAFSCSSRTKDFTTRMAFRSSCTTRFTSSVAPCREVKNGPTRLMTMATAITSRGITTRNTWLSRALMISAMTSAVTSMVGARTSIRMPIKVVICTEATSFVRRVTRLAVENRSMLAKENRCTCSYSARRSAAPKPMDALAASAAAPTPHASASSAINIIFTPAVRIYALSPVAMPTSTMSLITWGSSSSSTASPAEQAMASSISRR